MRKLSIFGTGEFGEVAAYYFANFSDFLVEGYVVEDDFLGNDFHRNLPVRSKSEFLEQNPPQESSIFIAIGYSNRNRNRWRIIEEFRALGYSFASFVSPNAFVAEGSIHPSTEHLFILEQNVIQPFSSISSDVIMWSGNHVGHHTTIGQGSFLTSKVAIAGGVKIGIRTTMGLGSLVIENLEIGDECLIAAGVVVKKSLGNGVLLVNNERPRAFPAGSW